MSEWIENMARSVEKWGPKTDRALRMVAVPINNGDVKDALAEVAALRSSLAEATRERDEAREACRLWAEWKIKTAEERDALASRLAESVGLLLDVWDAQHREGWEPTETERSVTDRLGDWRWNNGYDPFNPPLRPDPRLSPPAAHGETDGGKR